MLNSKIIFHQGWNIISCMACLFHLPSFTISISVTSLTYILNTVGSCIPVVRCCCSVIHDRVYENTNYEECGLNTCRV